MTSVRQGTPNMLIRFFRRFSAAARELTQLQGPLESYMGALVRRGYVFRREHAVWFDADSASCVASGILAFPDSIEAAESDVEVIAAWAEMMEVADAAVQTEYHPADLRECSYCTCQLPTDVIMQCDVLGGAPPLTCRREKAYVAPRRLALPDELQADLRVWEDLYTSIFRIWFYEYILGEWSEKQIYEDKSDLNIMGISIASRIASTLGIDVEYWRQPPDDDDY